MQNIQRSLVDRRSLNGLQVIRLHYNTADDIQKYMTVIRESIKVIEIGLRESNYQWQCSLFMLSLQVTYDQVIIVSTAKTSIRNDRKSSTNSQLQIQFKFSQRDLKLKS